MLPSSQINIYENSFVSTANSTFISPCYSLGFDKNAIVNATSAIANITNLNGFAGVYDQNAKFHINTCGDLQDYYVTYKLYNNYCDGDCNNKERDGIITVFTDYSNHGDSGVLHEVLCQIET